MADYWKSQPRKFCQYCKCWIADNKPSIEFHERGKNHKENVAAKIAEIKKKSVAKAKQEERMSKEFAAMEEAALKAYQEDLKRMGMESGTGSGLPVLAAPQPIPQPIQQPAPPNKKQQKKKHNKSSRGQKPTPTWVEGTTGDGNTYYYNTRTGESQWERPGGFQGGSDSVQPEQNESPWMECVSPDGYTYYYNSASGESSWERPTAGSVCEGQEPAAPQPPPPGEDRCAGGDHVAEEGIRQKRKAEDVSSEKEDEKEDEEEDEEEDEKEDEKPANDGGDAQENKNDQEEKKEAVQSMPAEPEVKTEVIPAKRTKAANPYGAWEKIQEEKDPYASVDLQLPQVEADAAAAALSELPPEPKPKFKERIITSLGGKGGPASFKKSKTHNGKTRSLRQRDDDDD